VSNNAERTGFGIFPTSILWVETIVGEVSPEPIIVRIRGSVMKKIRPVWRYVQLEQIVLGAEHEDHDRRG